ncbi:MAG: TetR/AcrR family transcriptional regulator [Actinomycetota bacterium]|nr:TetR/AcrR family transcriptional regulator [Actinomycetota bacterium]
MPSAPKTARARARAELTREIKDSARRQLGDVGAPALSLRAVSRELGMASSALYRYFPSRDDLLTALIVDAYESLGAVAEEASASTTGTEARWLAIATAMRRWATDNIHEYALIYGSPVPGYQAPEQTIPAAERVSLVMLRLVRDGVTDGDIISGDTISGDNDSGHVDDGERADALPDIPAPVRADFARIAAFAEAELPAPVVGRALLVWTNLFGTLSFELFGHLKNGVLDDDAFFEHQMRLAGRFLVAGIART